MKILNDHQRRLLADLIAEGGAATSATLGGWSHLGDRARNKSKRDGLVTYDGGSRGYWRITDAGRAAMTLPDNRTGGAVNCVNSHDALVKALREIIAANTDFRKGMPEKWDGDPLQDAIDAAAKLLLGDVGQENVE